MGTKSGADGDAIGLGSCSLFRTTQPSTETKPFPSFNSSANAMSQLTLAFRIGMSDPLPRSVKCVSDPLASNTVGRRPPTVKAFSRTRSGLWS